MQRVFKFLAWFIGLYHIVLGIVVTFAPTSILKWVVAIYRVNANLDPQFQYMAKFVAAYAIAFGVVVLFVAKDPIKYRCLVWAGVVLFGVRIFDRIYFYNLLSMAFETSMIQNVEMILTVLILGTGLYLTRPKAEWLRLIYVYKKAAFFAAFS